MSGSGTNRSTSYKRELARKLHMVGSFANVTNCTDGWRDKALDCDL